MRRLPPVEGELIDRSRAVEFLFEGKPVQGFRGDTLSSALSASGLRVLGRSFKYHRPRGLLSAAGHDANVLVQVEDAERSVPNVRADLVPVASCQWASTTRPFTASGCFRAGSACSVL
jgi:sarcosine oxidase, subunit alpha